MNSFKSDSINGETVAAQVRQQMFTKARKRGQRVPSTTAKVPSWYIRADGRKP